MQTPVTLPSTDFPFRFTQRLPARPSAAALLQTVQASQYREMEHAFRASGGFVSSDELVTLLMRRTEQPISQLAHWIVDRDVISFQWQLRTVLPLFQFDLSTVTPRPGVTAVIRELIPTLSDWDACLWFVAPNAWLADASPLEAISRDASAVLDAARGERYLLRG
ncbi:hypothetical protein RT97_23100 [Variovorax paradoxus]|jgi:hypothetical protein|uniref:Uncharacterized protein n=1 Tax=Variovorax paradoxus TaxID=34073 RepID=A0A0D0M996_VARPD|nr:hypothetical protein [Variovorax paradoxus]KIQ26145.1 hypothetical protein RT97_23100 [Variovorax paradoxus]